MICTVCTLGLEWAPSCFLLYRQAIRSCFYDSTISLKIFHVLLMILSSYITVVAWFLHLFVSWSDNGGSSELSSMACVIRDSDISHGHRQCRDGVGAEIYLHRASSWQRSTCCELHWNSYFPFRNRHHSDCYTSASLLMPI